MPPPPELKPEPAKKRTRSTEKPDHFVFDKEGQHYGPLPKDQALAFTRQLDGSVTIQAESLEEAGKQWRAAGIRQARGRAE